MAEVMVAQKKDSKKATHESNQILQESSTRYVITETKEIMHGEKLPKYTKVFEEIWLHQCNRCNHIWYSKQDSPKTCRNESCRSPYWNKKRVR